MEVGGAEDLGELAGVDRAEAFDAGDAGAFSGEQLAEGVVGDVDEEPGAGAQGGELAGGHGGEMAEEAVEVGGRPHRALVGPHRSDSDSLDGLWVSAVGSVSVC